MKTGKVQQLRNGEIFAVRCPVRTGKHSSYLTISLEMFKHLGWSTDDFLRLRTEGNKIVIERLVLDKVE